MLLGVELQGWEEGHTVQNPISKTHLRRGGAGRVLDQEGLFCALNFKRQHANTGGLDGESSSGI